MAEKNLVKEVESPVPSSPREGGTPFRLAFGPGEHINHAAKDLAGAALVYGAAEGEFNGILVTAKSGDTAEAIVARFLADMEAESVRYRNSEAGQRAARESALRLDRMQQRAGALMQVLPFLDLKNDMKVLDWLCALQEPSDYVGVKLDRAEVLKAFADSGYEPSVNIGADYNGEDRDNSFRYLVGQALDGLRGPAIHGILHKFADEWRAKFLRTDVPREDGDEQTRPKTSAASKASDNK